MSSEPTGDDSRSVPRELRRICIDWQYRAERYRPALLRFLAANRTELQLGDAEDLVKAYIERVWPNGLPSSAIVSNISLKDTQRWLIRVPADGPVAATFAARNKAPAFQVYLHGGVWVVDWCEIAPHVPPRPFEAVIAAPIFHNPRGMAIDPEDLAWLGQLPSHRKQMEQRLAEWNDLVAWQERNVRRSQIGVPYYRFEFLSPRVLRFLARSTLAGNVLWARLGSAQVLALPLSASQSTQEWRPAAEREERGPFVGEVRRVEPYEPGNGGTAAHPEVVVAVAVPENTDAESLRAALPAQGFLLASLAGELQPLLSGRRSIKRLRDSLGYNVYLGDYLFDISAADSGGQPGPDVVPDMELDADQQAALRKIIAARDICLVEGPPGSGKTTLIVAVTVYLVARGERVLVASQSNTAVDNVLTRLAGRRGILVLRIAQAGRVDPESQQFLEENVVPTWGGAVQRRTEERSRIIERQGENLRQAREMLLRAGQFIVQSAQVRTRAVALEQELAHAGADQDAAQRARQAHAGQIERLGRERDVARELAGWNAESGAQPALELLADSPLAAAMTALAAELRTASNDPWPMVGQTALRTPGEAVQVIVHARTAVQRLTELLPTVGTCLSLVRQKSHSVPNEAGQRAAALLSEKATLVHSDSEQDIARLVEINRALAALRDQAWAQTIRTLRTLLLDVFGGALPTELEDLTSSLGPAATWMPVLEALQAIAQQVPERLRKALDPGLARLRELAGAQLASASQRLATEQAAAAQDEQRVAEVKGRVAEVSDRLDVARRDVREVEQRWNELWENYPFSPPDQRTPPALDPQAWPAVERQLTARIAQETAAHEALAPWQVVRSEWLELLADAAALRHDRLRSLYVENANVVGATCNETARPSFYDGPHFKPFNTVIIDEVSKATPPELIAPALLGHRVVCLGDRHQLEPMFRERECSYGEAADDGQLERAEYERYRKLVTASLFRQLYEAAPEALRHMLARIYRSHPQIIRIFSLFYEGQLLAGGGEDHLDRLRQHHLLIPDLRGGRLLEPHNHVLWVDSTRNQRGYYAYEKQRGTSKVNLLEAELIASLLRHLNGALVQRGYGAQRTATVEASADGQRLAAWITQTWPNIAAPTVADLLGRGGAKVNGRLAKGEEPVHAGDRVEFGGRKPVAVITFYGAQLRELRQRIGQLGRVTPDALSATDVRTNTVDCFQGMECPIVLVSLVRAQRDPRLSEHVRHYQRMNVAFSRAQELLVIVGATRTFRDGLVDLPPLTGGQPRAVPVYRQILELVQQFGGMRYAHQLLA